MDVNHTRGFSQLQIMRSEEGASATCATAIWPQAQELKDVIAPETSQESRYHLEMQDDFGNVFTSPVFVLGAPSGGKASVFTALSPDSAKSSESQEAPTGAPPAKASRSSTKASETAKHPSGSKLGGNLWACAHAWYPVCYFQFITYSIIALRAILFFSDVSIRLPPEPYYCVICRLSVRDKED
ncbi:hypothetical protein AGABI2DRAFT_114699 [Agaricus bisporus var. bisporus H97]|uniref:hypothetical protein n=1 Tax=Agaricus bisporus var. bisporus (strain H97 / ATCC MYA-4626 / FGSC 10389) TaxID=936046 RepID=UPI00029F4EDF|nr:hypothetical protein AGABI2DRAFT_114699 [Agaricus bisporus var. bisporus H97]EKV51964.1 hypothetical protein AGABI2DRAFT_114699 [Agaricus bisporus var. bisporus H97]